jgi:hypothetical protein
MTVITINENGHEREITAKDIRAISFDSGRIMVKLKGLKNSFNTFIDGITPKRKSNDSYMGENI